jgi:putative intracellular protease/amidase
MLQVAVLLYPRCVFFEVALAAQVLASRFPLVYLTPDGADHHSSTGALIVSDGAFDTLIDHELAAVLIPGGDPHSILVPQHKALSSLVELANRDVLLAGICAGNLILAAAGVLKGRRGTHNYTSEHADAENVDATTKYWDGMVFERANLVKDGCIITAQPWAYREYAAAVAQVLGVLTSDEAAELRNYPTSRSYASIGA